MVRLMKEVALTFDDGPWGLTTPKVLDELIKRRIPATFMIWGEHAVQYPDILLRAADSGLFAFGNHTFTHPSLLSKTAAEISDELRKTDDIVKTLTGVAPEFVRPPFGDANEQTLEFVNRPVICWSLDTESWNHHDAALCLEKAKAAKDGDIILMHDFQEADADALPAIIDFLSSEDFVFKTVPDLIGAKLLDEPYIYYSRDERDKVGFAK